MDSTGSVGCKKYARHERNEKLLGEAEKRTLQGKGGGQLQAAKFQRTTEKVWVSVGKIPVHRSEMTNDEAQ